MTHYRKNRKRSSQSFEGEESMTVQSDRTRADIQRIIAQGAPEVDPQQMQFADVSEIGDYRELREIVETINDGFSTLPSDVRKHFDNDVANLLDAMGDPDRNQEMIDLGLRPQPEDKPKPPVVSDEPVKGAPPVAPPERGSESPKKGDS